MDAMVEPAGSLRAAKCVMLAAMSTDASLSRPGNNASASGRDRNPRDLREILRSLYEGDSREAHRFRYGLLAFDILTVLFIVATSFIERARWLEWVDALFGLIILADFCARLVISRRPLRDLLHPATWADAVAIVSFLAPVVGEGAGFLRILRTLRLLHTYQIIGKLRRDSGFFRRNEEVILSIVHLCVFLFCMSAIVYETQHWSNPEIGNYVDALYFTVSALTTTGFGDIVLEGTSGKLISVLIMIFGVTLFLRLVRALLAPHKVRFPCPACGLQRHDVDAVHCKACGTLLNIPDEGYS
jgi:voltage-gated potassium channel